MRSRRLACALVLSMAPAPASSQGQPGVPAAIAIARISYVDDLVEVRRPGQASWGRVDIGAELRIGDRLRTGPRGTVRIDFPWMAVALAGSSELSVPPSLVLATVLEEGRVEQSSPTREIVKLLTAEARVRGEGRATVRREQGRTLVSTLQGSFSVEAAGQIVTVGAGEGTLVVAGSPPAPARALPAAPRGLDPGDDPLYVLPGEPVTLRFESAAKAHHLQVLGVDSTEVLLERDIAGSPATVVIPWEGTFRWRVSARDADGLEGLPSREGLIAVVAR